MKQALSAKDAKDAKKAKSAMAKEFINAGPTPSLAVLCAPSVLCGQKTKIGVSVRWMREQGRIPMSYRITSSTLARVIGW
jgi:hypothetical protein